MAKDDDFLGPVIDMVDDAEQLMEAAMGSTTGHDSIEAGGDIGAAPKNLAQFKWVVFKIPKPPTFRHTRAALKAMEKAHKKRWGGSKPGRPTDRLYTDRAYLKNLVHPLGNTQAFSISKLKFITPLKLPNQIPSPLGPKAQAEWPKTGLKVPGFAPTIKAWNRHTTGKYRPTSMKARVSFNQIFGNLKGIGKNVAGYAGKFRSFPTPKARIGILPDTIRAARTNFNILKNMMREVGQIGYQMNELGFNLDDMIAHKNGVFKTFGRQLAQLPAEAQKYILKATEAMGASVGKYTADINKKVSVITGKNFLKQQGWMKTYNSWLGKDMDNLFKVQMGQESKLIKAIQKDMGALNKWVQKIMDGITKNIETNIKNLTGGIDGELKKRVSEFTTKVTQARKDFQKQIDRSVSLLNSKIKGAQNAIKQATRKFTAKYNSAVKKISGMGKVIDGQAKKITKMFNDMSDLKSRIESLEARIPKVPEKGKSPFDFKF